MPEQETPIEEEKLLSEQYEEILGRARKGFAEAYDQAIEAGEDPREYLFKDNPLEESGEIFGGERIKELVNNIKSMSFTGRDDFVEQGINLVSPFIRERVYDPEVRARAEAAEAKRNILENIEIGGVTATIHRADWDFKLSDGTEINKNDMVVEIGWPDKAKIRGLKDLQASFRQLAANLSSREEIKAILGVSWMMSREITSKLGFEKFPELEVEPQRKFEIVNLATEARKDKEYEKGVKPEEIIVGAMSRQEFIKRYG